MSSAGNAKRPREGSDDLPSVVDDVNSHSAQLNNLMTTIEELKEALNLLREDVGSIRQEVSGIKPVQDSLDEVHRKLDRQETRLDRIDEELKRQDDEVEKMKERTVEMEEKISKIEERLVDQEARGRRNNLLFHGIDEREGEDCAKAVKDVLEKGGLAANRVSIERAHRIGRRAGGRTRAIIARFLDYNDREAARRARKNFPSGITVAEDFPVEVRQARKRLIPEMLEAKRTGHEAWIAYPARLIVDGNLKRTEKPTIREVN